MGRSARTGTLEERLTIGKHLMCTCIQKANAALREHNTTLALELTIDMKTGRSRQVLPVPTKQIKKSRNGKLHLMARHCPFCGEQWEKDELGTDG